MRSLTLIALIALVASCSTGEPTTATSSSSPAASTTSAATATSTIATTTTSTTLLPPGDLPPHRFEELAAIFDPVVAPLGYEVSRGALITRSTYEVDPDGDHLAIYLAPLEDLGPDRLAADLAPITAAFVPLVFEMWPDLASFDVCQEPFGSGEETPPSLTIVDLTRAAAAAGEWEDLDLASLIAQGSTIDGLTVWSRTPIRDSATWTDAAGG